MENYSFSFWDSFWDNSISFLALSSANSWSFLASCSCNEFLIVASANFIALSLSFSASASLLWISSSNWWSRTCFKISAKPASSTLNSFLQLGQINSQKTNYSSIKVVAKINKTLKINSGETLNLGRN